MYQLVLYLQGKFFFFRLCFEAIHSQKKGLKRIDRKMSASIKEIHPEPDEAVILQDYTAF